MLGYCPSCAYPITPPLQLKLLNKEPVICLNCGINITNLVYKLEEKESNDEFKQCATCRSLKNELCFNKLSKFYAKPLKDIDNEGCSFHD